MDLGVAGKVAVVFGASRGLGKAVAQRLGDEGAKVACVSRSLTSASSVANSMDRAGASAWAFACDVTRRDEVADVFSLIRGEVGSPSIVVYNNSGPPDSTFDEATDDEFYDAYKSTVLGFSWVVREAVPSMKAERWGRILTLGSMAAKEPHRELPLALHNVVRPAAVGLSKTLSVDLGPFGITVNTLGTGTIDGDDDSSLRRTYREQAAISGKTFEELLSSRLAVIPLRRGGTAEEVASLAAFICSDLAGFLTGQTIILDGGLLRSLL